MQITSDTLDSAAEAVLDTARAETHTDAPAPPDDEDDGDQEATYLAHLEGCERCQLAEAIQGSKHVSGMVRQAIYSYADGEMSLTSALGNAILFGLKVGREVERRAAQDTPQVDETYEAMRADQGVSYDELCDVLSKEPQ